MTRFFILQDGPDFYLYRDESCTELHNTLTYPKRVGLNLDLALKARVWFESVMREAGFRFAYVNPFASTSSESKPAPAAYTGKPASSVTRMVDMSAHTGDDLEF